MKRPLTRAEKALFVVPVLFLVAGFFPWRRPNHVVAQIDLPGNTPRALVFSPDGKRLLCAGSSRMGLVYNLETKDRPVTLEWPHRWASLMEASWSPDGQRIVAGYRDGETTQTNLGRGKPPRKNRIDKIALWNPATGRLIAKWPYGTRIEDSYAKAYFTRDGKKLFGSGAPPALFDAATGARLRRFNFDRKSENGSELTGHLNWNENLIALQHYHLNRLKVVDLNSNRVLWQPDVRPGGDGSVRWSKNNVLGVINYEYPSGSRTLELWNGNTRRSFPPQPNQDVEKFALNDRVPLVATACVEFANQDRDIFQSGHLEVDDYLAGKTSWQVPLYGLPVRLDWSDDGKYLLLLEFVSPSVQHLRVYDASGMLALEVKDMALETAVWSPDSKRIAVVTNSGVQVLKLPIPGA